MNEQTIILIFLVMALGITLWLYILKAIKQVNYKGDERWKLIQLKANNAANLAHSILIVLIAVLPLFINMQTTVTLQRVSIFALLYIGIRNLIELVATIYLDKLIVLIAVLPLFINMQTTVTLQRVSIFALLYIGIRNLIELVATIYLDKKL